MATKLVEVFASPGKPVGLNDVASTEMGLGQNLVSQIAMFVSRMMRDGSLVQLFGLRTQGGNLVGWNEISNDCVALGPKLFESGIQNSRINLHSTILPQLINLPLAAFPVGRSQLEFL